jgi:ABC-type sugar transport system ATPase subunit
LDAFIPGVVDAKLRIADLSVAKQQIVCIVRALYRNPKILVFDEPTSRLSAPETEALFSAINKMRKERELTIIYISHRLEELFRICDRVTILRDGICTGTWELSTLSKEDIVNKMVGTIQTTEKSTRQISPVNTSEPVLRIEGITIENLINNISFSVYPGEVISLFGAVGSRKTELLEAILGIRQYDSGKVFINGKETKLTGARSAKKHGICLIPEDRRKYGLIYDFTIRENITIAFLRHFLTLFGFIHKNNEIKNVKDICNTLQVKMPSTEVRVKTLSGGNQQKIVVAKWLLGNSEIYIFDEPTVGIDVRGKNEIHDIIHRLADEGKAVIMSSSEVDEAIKTGDRIVVLFNGQVAAQYNSADVNYEEIVYLSMGGKRNAV